MSLISCKTCHLPKEPADFQTQFIRGKLYRRGKCRECLTRDDQARRPRKGESLPAGCRRCRRCKKLLRASYHFYRSAAGYYYSDCIACHAKRYIVYGPTWRRTYPYFTDSLLSIISAVVPQLGSDLRSDVCQDLAVAVLSGEIEQSQISSQYRRFVRDAYAVENRFKFVSYDQPGIVRLRLVGEYRA